MKITAIIMMTFMSFINTNAQNKDAYRHSYRAGDELRKQMIAYSGNGMAGKNAVWNFSEMNILDDNHISKYYTVANKKDTIAGIENRTIYYYTEREDTLFKTGYENNTTLVCYNRPEAILHYPIVYGDKISGVFHGTGSYSERIKARVSGIYEVEADAEGTLILPDGVTLHNVVRVHSRKLTRWKTLEDIHTKQELKLYADSIAYFNIDSIATEIHRDMKVLEINKYCWYGAGYRYPVIETTSVTDKSGSVLYLTSYYCPVTEQELLYDEENRIVRESNREKTIENESTGNKQGNNNSFHYKAYTDGYNLNISYSLEQDASIKILVCSMTGIVYKTRTITGHAGDNGDMKIDCSGLKPGDYVVYINVYGDTYSCKVCF